MSAIANVMVRFDGRALMNPYTITAELVIDEVSMGIGVSYFRTTEEVDERLARLADTAKHGDIELNVTDYRKAAK